MSRRCASLPLVTTLLASLTLALSAATLEQLSEARLIDESTEIVRGTVTYCTQTYRQPVIWTVCEVAVTERFKGQPATKILVAIPGGTASGFRQSFEGSPTLTRNSEYLFFLWQGKSGLKQIMGLSQGLLNIVKDANGNLMVARAKAEDRMVTPEGQPVQDPGVNLRLSDMRSRISSRQQPRGARQ